MTDPEKRFPHELHTCTHTLCVGEISNRWGLTECWCVSVAQMQLGHVLVAPERRRKWFCWEKITSHESEKRRNDEAWKDTAKRKKWLSFRKWVRHARHVSPYYVFSWDVIYLKKGFLREPPTSQSSSVLPGSDRPPTLSFNRFRLQVYSSLLSQSHTQSMCAEIKYGLIESLFIKIIVCCILESAIKEQNDITEANCSPDPCLRGENRREEMWKGYFSPQYLEALWGNRPSIWRVEQPGVLEILTVRSRLRLHMPSSVSQWHIYSSLLSINYSINND